ncbi:hypothetical protein SAMN05444369_1124 [Capnocytophaga haemolytica]|jgi:hypothetical protein|uniref:DUF3899 domain-containing protein n=1 Tax=Capnocytophaga haemolytica TaxID=45243 RepID=A0AAX2GU02_9FLAO|nr:hypothetical protein [Capnocytophaga haemolytica]AMD85491.1 hypothetical protein AXF12_08175 [Capnocytophaga haemolytica]SFO17821.1 hypothetical protein SAMN05444369_1124 [Capnocytophaga haemolytica]SNV01050.1 Uncharacterised protein [Capnocytophaga haemolytica]
MEQKLKHLEFIHNTINRMDTNSFIIKGWCITLVAALFAIIAKESNILHCVIAVFVIIIFWSLNAYFLQLERKYRDLYDEVRDKKEEEIDFSMDIKKFSRSNPFCCSFFSGSLSLFYLPQIILVMFYTLLILIGK